MHLPVLVLLHAWATILDVYCSATSVAANHSAFSARHFLNFIFFFLLRAAGFGGSASSPSAAAQLKASWCLSQSGDDVPRRSAMLGRMA